MKKNLLCISAGLSLCSLLYGVSANAQIKGDPAFSGVLQQQTSPKTPSILSPDLKKLSTSYQTPKTKAPQALTKPTPGTGTDYFNKYMQIKGDKVVIDVTAKDDLATAKTELQKLGATITATYGRVISAIIPIASLPQLETSTSIRFARPAYRPLHVKQHALDASGYFAPKKITPVISQGDTAQLSYLARKQYKVDGKGVKVGVLSDSYNNLGSAAIGVAHGELPGATNPFNYKKTRPGIVRPRFRWYRRRTRHVRDHSRRCTGFRTGLSYSRQRSGRFCKWHPPIGTPGMQCHR